MPVAPEGAGGTLLMDTVTIVLILTAALGAFVRALNTNDQAWKSVQTVTDVLIGGALGALTPLVWTIPGKNLTEQGAVMFLLALGGLQTVKDLLTRFGVSIPKFTAKSLLLPLAGLLALTGCATTLGQQAEQGLAAALGPDAIKALQDLKALPIIAKVKQDAAATRAWADKVLGPVGAKPDPVKYQLALACPTATDAVGGMIQQTLDGLIAQIQAMQTPADPNEPQGFAMLLLTQLKYGDQPNPQARLNGLKAQLALQADALFTGCAHLFPKKQMNDALRLLGKAGIVGFSGGTLAPLMGVVP